MALSPWYLPAVLQIFITPYINLAGATTTVEKPLQLENEAVGYAPGQAVPVTCLNRTIDTGEHITDSHGQLQYIPFPTCNETNRPLELLFGIEKEINCTLPSLPDPLFHLLEFYIHNDAPLTCRVPSSPAPSSPAPDHQQAYTPLQIALAGTLQLSHLHITPTLNLILHTAPFPLLSSSSESENSPVAPVKRGKGKRSGPAQILAATAYSIPHPSSLTFSSSSSSDRLIIGDPLPLRFSPRWYASPSLPASTSATSGLGGHVHISTVVYCLLSVGVGIAGTWAWWRGVELPRRVRGWRSGGGGAGEKEKRGYAWPGSAGGGGPMGMGNGWAGSGSGSGGGNWGKRD